MELRNKNILLVSPEPWDHLFVSKHHYAVHLGRQGCKVFFLNPPTTKNNIQETEYANVWEVNYTGFPRGLRFFPAFVQRVFIKRKFKQLQDICLLNFDVVWSFDNSVFFDFDALPENVFKISHIVDLNQDFQTGKAAYTADVCFCTTDFIKDRLSRYNKAVYKINHGLSLKKQEDSFTLPGRSTIKAMYMGNLAMQYLDWRSLSQLTLENPEVDFIFVGSGKDELSEEANEFHIYKKNMCQHENAFFCDKVPSEYIYAYLSEADVLLVAYQEKYHKDQANPHKMMEYLGSGKMIVCTYTAEYEALAKQGLILMSNKNNEFPHLFKSVVHSLAEWNSNEKQKARQAFALENTYDKQIEKISALIANGKSN